MSGVPIWLRFWLLPEIRKSLKKVSMDQAETVKKVSPEDLMFLTKYSRHLPTTHQDHIFQVGRICQALLPGAVCKVSRHPGASNGPHLTQGWAGRAHKMPLSQNGPRAQTSL